jgi:hypothetical protein
MHLLTQTQTIAVVAATVMVVVAATVMAAAVGTSN